MDNFDEVLDLLSRLGGFGSKGSSIYEQLRGISSLGVPPTMPMQRKQFGLTFFTRPRLNLSKENLMAFRPFSPMMAANKTATLPAYVRALLDPVGVQQRNESSIILDPKQAFIPWLSNGLVSQSGWPDIAPGTFTSASGNHHEEWSFIDDTAKVWRTWDLSLTFRNGIGDLIILILFVWVVYASLVYEGEMYPYPEAIIEHEIDYFSRCYRFGLDQTKETVVDLASTLCFPYTVPTGQILNFSMDSPMNEEGAQISTMFRCVGMDFADDIIVKEFNEIVSWFNHDMYDQARDSKMVRLSAQEYPTFDYWIYYRINPDDRTLERYVSREKYDQVQAQLKVGINGFLPAANIAALPRSYGGIPVSQQTQVAGDPGTSGNNIA